MLVPLDGPEDPRLAPFLGLRDQRARQRLEQPGGRWAGTFIGEGLMVLRRALAAGHQLESVLTDQAGGEAVEAVVPAGVPVYVADPDAMTAVAGRPKLRDPIGCFRRPEAMALESLLEAAQTVAVLEGVVNPTNMGVIARNAAGLGCDGLIVDPTSVDPLARRAVRASMGEVFAMTHLQLRSLTFGLDELRRLGFALVALTPDPTARDISEYVRPSGQRMAIILGSEGHGLSATTLGAADELVRIPMSHPVDSLNVGSAAAVAFHALRRRG